MKKALLLFAILLLPTLVYIFFSLGVPKVSRAPFYGPRHAVNVTDKNGSPAIDTAYSIIPHFLCKTNDAALFDSRSLDGQLYVAVFVDPDSLKTLFPILAEDIRLNRQDYQYARFVFFMPGDSAGNIFTPADIGKDLGVGRDTAYTLFLPRTMFDTLRNNHYFIADPFRKKDPWHSKSDAVLIDRVGRIRGYYNIRFADQLKKMKEDIPYIRFHDEASKTIENSTVKQQK